MIADSPRLAGVGLLLALGNAFVGPACTKVNKVKDGLSVHVVYLLW